MTDTTKMNPEVKTKWIEALRSGEYPQGYRALKTGMGFCCLGVLCDVYRKEHQDSSRWEMTATGRYEFVAKAKNGGRDTSLSILPSTVAVWAGLSGAPAGMLPIVKYNERETGLATLNDSNGLSFNQIADVVGEQL